MVRWSPSLVAGLGEAHHAVRRALRPEQLLVREDHDEGVPPGRRDGEARGRPQLDAGAREARWYRGERVSVPVEAVVGGGQGGIRHRRLRRLSAWAVEREWWMHGQKQLSCSSPGGGGKLECMEECLRIRCFDSWASGSTSQGQHVTGHMIFAITWSISRGKPLATLGVNLPLEHDLRLNPHEEMLNKHGVERRREAACPTCTSVCE